MILFDICAVKSILLTIALYLGIATPPILISQTRQLISYCHFLSTINIDLSTLPGLDLNQEQLTSSSEFSPSLELTMFNQTNYGFCPSLGKNFSTAMSQAFLVHGLHSTSSKLHTECLNQSDKNQPTPRYLVKNSLSNTMDSLLTEGISTMLVCHNSSTHDNDMPGWQSVESYLHLDLKIEGQWEKNVPSHVNQRVVHLVLELTLSIVLNETICSEESTTLTSDRQELLDGHHHLPGSDYGVMWYHEQLRTYLRNSLLTALPESWAEWITNNRPLLGIICVTVMYISLLWPLLGVIWKQMKAKKKAIKELEIANRASHIADALILRLKEQEKILTGKLSDVYKHSYNMDELVNSHIEKLSQIDKVIVEMSDQVSEVNRLEDEAQIMLEKVAVLDSKFSQLQSRVADLTEQKKSLEIENQLLKYVEKASISSLISLQISYDKTSEELSTIKERQAVLESQLSFTSEELNIKAAKLCEQNKELKELSDCLSLVTSQTDMLACLNFGGDALDEKVEVYDMEDSELKCPLPDVQNIQDKVEAEITHQQSMKQIQQLSLELEMKESLFKEHATENSGSLDCIVLLEEESKITTDQLHENKLKFEGIIESFHSKENKLYKKVVSTEIKLQQSEQLATETQEKQLMEIKQQLEAVNKSLNAQVCVNKERAKNARKFTKDTEQHLRQMNKEIAELNKRLNVKREPSTPQQGYLSTNKREPSTPEQGYLSTNKTCVHGNQRLLSIPLLLQNTPMSPVTSLLHSVTSCHYHKTYRATELTQTLPSIKEPVLSNRTPFHPRSLFKTKRKVQGTKKVSFELDQTEIIAVADIDSSLSSMSMSVPSSA